MNEKEARRIKGRERALAPGATKLRLLRNAGIAHGLAVDLGKLLRGAKKNKHEKQMSDCKEGTRKDKIRDRTPVRILLHVTHLKHVLCQILPSASQCSANGPWRISFSHAPHTPNVAIHEKEASSVKDGGVHARPARGPRTHGFFGSWQRETISARSIRFGSYVSERCWRSRCGWCGASRRSTRIAWRSA